MLSRRLRTGARGDTLFLENAVTITLMAGDLRVVLEPETGGAIAAFTCGGVEILRGVADARLAAQHGRAVAYYPLLPFANRVRLGQFAFGGESYRLDRNFGDSPNTIHGNAWMHPWTVTEHDARSLRCRFVFVPEGALAGQWPFAYEAEQTFELSDDGLHVALSLRNTDTRAWPAGLGVHPYVARTPRTTLQFEADSIWTVGADEMPAERQAVGGAWSFDRPRPLDHAHIDNCYAGWGGTATVTMPEHTIAVVLRAEPPLDHLQLYTPTGRDFIGLEPVSNMPDAINRMDEVADQGLVVLQPGEALHAALSLRVTRD